MPIERAAAYHEAAHAIVAHHSRFHALVGPINLASYGAGEIFISLSETKLKAAGKKTPPDAQKDTEVAQDLARVLTAGYIAEQIAAENDSKIIPNAECAKPDHDFLRQQLSAARLSLKFDRAEEGVREFLTSKWEVMEGSRICFTKEAERQSMKSLR
jgi:hypothetical protein